MRGIEKVLIKKMAIEQEDISQTADKISVCEKKLVEESGTVKSRYSPLCRQVGVVCCFENRAMLSQCDVFDLLKYVSYICFRSLLELAAHLP